MIRSGKLYIRQVLLLIFCLLGIEMSFINANAANQTIQVNSGDYQNVTINVGDTGIIVPNQTASDETVVQPGIGTDEYGNPAYGMDTSSRAVRFEYSIDAGSYRDETYMKVNYDGTYQAVAPGSETVRITGYNSYGYSVFSATIYFTINLDMTNVTLGRTALKGYLFPYSYFGDFVYYSDAEFEVKVNSAVVLNENMNGLELSCNSSNKKISAYATLSNNVLHLQVSAQKKGKTVLTIQIAGKQFTIAVSLNTVGISANSCLMEKGQSKKLKITGYSGKITWKSTNKKIAAVSSKGTVKGKKIGNVVITAKIGDQRIGCAVSVTTKKLKKVCARATYIGTHWKYSQAKRTQSGYYDCSALVWKAYKQYAGITFGSPGYPGTTATESAWCKAHGCMLKGGFTYKKLSNMKLNPGDIVFKSTDSAKPYSTTYHVEMFTGYTCQGYDSDGKPIVEALWAARGSGYGAEEGSLLARPMK